MENNIRKLNSKRAGLMKAVTVEYINLVTDKGKSLYH
jgi:hypothetical protein